MADEDAYLAEFYDRFSEEESGSDDGGAAGGGIANGHQAAAAAGGGASGGDASELHGEAGDLPPGWVLERSTSTGKTFFFNPKTRAKHWQDKTLPFPWGLNIDRKGQKTYVQLVTGERTSQRPQHKRRRKAKSTQSHQARNGEGEWKLVYSEKWKCRYYFNKQTRKQYWREENTAKGWAFEWGPKREKLFINVFTGETADSPPPLSRGVKGEENREEGEIEEGEIASGDDHIEDKSGSYSADDRGSRRKRDRSRERQLESGSRLRRSSSHGSSPRRRGDDREGGDRYARRGKSKDSSRDDGAHWGRNRSRQNHDDYDRRRRWSRSRSRSPPYDRRDRSHYRIDEGFDDHGGSGGPGEFANHQVVNYPPVGPPPSYPGVQQNGVPDQPSSSVIDNVMITAAAAAAAAAGEGGEARTGARIGGNRGPRPLSSSSPKSSGGARMTGNDSDPDVEYSR